MKSKGIKTRGQKEKAVQTRGPKERAISSSEIQAALGAEHVGNSSKGSGVLALRFLRQELATRLRSTGGRPALEGAESRKKIPMTDAEWKQLVSLVDALKARGVKATPAQVASILLHKALMELREQDLEEEFLKQATG